MPFTRYDSAAESGQDVILFHWRSAYSTIPEMLSTALLISFVPCSHFAALAAVRLPACRDMPIHPQPFPCHNDREAVPSLRGIPLGSSITAQERSSAGDRIHCRIF
ncbi:uncharacterized protein BT62DRAFT_1012109 [Guyanagaster necrorhizus]|uniref:Uncharacterized protein n=1 Tax=Guyanagaster necrorhizus TaxID=856835 RepID=A0A9P7VI91_9AGAR|nr:uncharacterized protein BT62DRAFT_1012109 [Guyanagaster necrorhizus MCA 3950]KAG7441068.1 hypothetical protein BT62DRAFT_1012109 [Guyanagaster necrorhizus MCA 3950]